MKRILLALCVLPLATGCGLLRPRPPEYPHVRFEDGLVVHDLVVPEEGPEVQFGDRLTLAYSIRLAVGRELVDSSAERGEPLQLEFVPGALFPGLERGLLGMRLRGSRELWIPAALAYGDEGRPPRIPPGADLRAELEVLELER